MREFFEDGGISHETSTAKFPEQNGKIERGNRVVIEAARCLLIYAGRDKRYCAEAVHTVVYVRKRSPSKAVSGEIPEELWSKRKVSLSNLRVSGCLAFVHTPKENRKKLDPMIRCLLARYLLVTVRIARGIGCLVSMGLASWSRRKIMCFLGMFYRKNPRNGGKSGRDKHYYLEFSG